MQSFWNKLNKFNSLQIFHFLRFGTFFLISILLAKVSMIYQHEYGLRLISQYENLMLATSSLTFFWVAGISNTLIPYYQNGDEFVKKKVLFNAFFLFLIFSIVAGIIVAFMGFFHDRDKNLFHMFGLVMMLNTPTYIADYIFYLKEKYKSLIIWGIITFTAHILLLCVPLYFKQSLNLGINLLLVLSLVKFNYTIILLMKYSSISINMDLIFDFMKKVLPIMFSVLLAGSMDYINSYIVEFNFSDEEFAMFRYGAKELPVFLILANSLSSVYSGEIAQLSQDGRLNKGLERLKSSSRKLMRWLFPATILLMFASPYLFRYAYNEELLGGYRIFNIFLLLIISRMIYPQTVIMGMMKNKIFYLVSSNYLLINCILSFWFMHLFGLEGIAYATVISFLIEKAMLATYCKMQGIDFRSYTPWMEHLVYSILTLVAFYVTTVVEMPMP